MATMEMIGKTALGVTFNAQTGGCNQFVEHLQTAMHVCFYTLSNTHYYLYYLLRVNVNNKLSSIALNNLPLILGMGV